MCSPRYVAISYCMIPRSTELKVMQQTDDTRTAAARVCAIAPPIHTGVS